MTSQVSLKRIKKPDEINHFIIHKSADTESDWKKSLSTVTITLNETIEFKSINPETNYTNQIVYFQCIELSESLEPLLEFIDPIPICHGFQFEKLKVISYDSEMEQLNQELESILEFKVKNAIYVVGQRGNGKRTLINFVVTKLLELPLYYFNLFEETAYRRHQNHRNRELGKTPLARLLDEMPYKSVLLLDGLELLGTYKWKDFDVNEFVKDTMEILRSTRQGIAIVATCNDTTSLPASFQVSTDEQVVFGTEISIGMPDYNQRVEFLKLFLKRDYDWIPQCANQTVGYSIRDLYLICIERAMIPLQDQLQDLSLGGSLDHMMKVIRKHKPTLESNGFDTMKPQISWDQVGGYQEIRSQLEQLILWPTMRPEVFERFQMTPPKGLLLYGPSGCGKTFLVHAFVSNSPFHFISVKTHQIYSKYLGESEQKIRLLFETCRKSRPCILFFDRIDSIGMRREWDQDGSSGVQERVLSTLLNEMDGVSDLNGVFVIACTNDPRTLDDALKRPGRLDVHLLVDRPTVSDRKDIIEAIKRSSPLNLSEKDIDWIVKETEGFTSSDVIQLIREAGMIALEESSLEIEMSHVIESLGIGFQENGHWRPQIVFQ